MDGVIFDIQRCSMHDGPGIRTTVFFKGCPLRCLWCHNPESQAFEPELALFQNKCTRCRACEGACPNRAHRFDERGHRLDRAACTLCGRCVEACPSGALKKYGRRASAAQIVDTALKDAAYYAATGGGLTVSGGEPLAQPDFLERVLALAKQKGLNTCVETSGYAPWAHFERVLKWTDLFLYDVKAPPGAHRALTGGDGDRPLDNLKALMGRGAQVVLRCPIVPGLNDTDQHFAGLAALALAYPALAGIEILPYHDMGRGKALAIGREYPVEGPTAADALKRDWKARMRLAGLPASAVDSF